MICIILTTLLQICNPSVYQLIMDNEIIYPKVALAISRQETGHFKYVKHNNLYGFKSKGKYKRYSSRNESVKDYKVFEARIIKKYNIRSHNQYLAVLSRFYARDPRWTRKIKKLI